MPRPSLPIGTAGEIRTYPYATAKGETRYRATCLYRDYDGAVRPIERRGPTRASAVTRLREAVRDRSYVDLDSEITRDAKVSKLVELWYSEVKTAVADGDLSPTTADQYRYQLDRHVIPALGELRICEAASVSRIDRLVKTVRENTKTRRKRELKGNQGAASAKLLRTVLSGVFGLAVRHDAIDVNPVRDIGKIVNRSKPSRSLSVDEAIDLRVKIHANEKAQRRDLVDFSDLMVGTGFRIGEASAVIWDAIDLEEGTVEVRGTVVRLKGIGLVIKWFPKSRAGFRTVELAPWTIDMLTNRKPVNVDPYSVVFTTSTGTLRDPSNTEAQLRELFDEAGYDWVTSHIWRKFVATQMDEADLSARAAADQLGHANVSMTQNVYFGRKTVRTGAALVLQNIFQPDGGNQK